jgi:hypothetical protein
MCTESCSIWCNTLTVYAVRLTALAVAHQNACLIVRGYKTAETKMTAHLKKMCRRYVVLYAKCQLPRMESLPAKSSGLIDELRLHFPDASDEMMNSPWPQACENSDGHAWALVQLGETVTKTCCGTPCTHDWEPLTAVDIFSHFWCTRKHLCVHQNWKFKHATRILDVIMLQYPIKVHPMPGMWIQSIPVTAIPWGLMNIGQRGTLLSSIREG